jgi:hypothetical protein
MRRLRAFWTASLGLRIGGRFGMGWHGEAGETALSGAAGPSIGGGGMFAESEPSLMDSAATLAEDTEKPA